MSDSPSASPPIDDSPEVLLQDLVGDDRFYEEVAARLEDPNEVGYLGYTLLHIASWSLQQNPRIVNLLLERGADVNAVTEYGYTPLHFAVASRNRNAVVAFIEAGAFVNKGDNCGRTALHFSIGSNWTFPPIPILNFPCDMWIVKRLLCHPEIDLNPKDSAGATPLMWAINRRDPYAVKKLLEKGANQNIPNISGRTPLHRALSHQIRELSIVHNLLINGAGIYCEDMFGKTPIDILVENVRKNNSILSAKYIVWLIALHYRIEDSLKRKLKQVPELSDYFEKCHVEVSLMHRQVIYDKFTLHDFTLNCYQTRFFGENENISTPVIPLLLSGSYVLYLHYIMEHL